MGLLFGLFFGLGIGLIGSFLFLRLSQRGMFATMSGELGAGNRPNLATLLPTPTLSPTNQPQPQTDLAQNPTSDSATDSGGVIDSPTNDNNTENQGGNGSGGVLTLTQQQISERLLTRIREMGILQGDENGVILQNGTVTFYDVQTFFAIKNRTEVVATIYANNGQPEVTLLKADMAGMPLPDSIQQEVKTNFQAVVTAELQSMINYTYIDNITINNGELVVLYH